MTTALPLALLLLSAAPPGGSCLEVAVDRLAGAWAVGPAWHLPAQRCAGATTGAAGPLALVALGPKGRVLGSAPVALAAVADGGAGDAGATARLRLDERALRALEALELREGATALARRQREGNGGPDRASVRRRGPNLVIRWDDRAWPYALVRDAATGAVLGAAQRGRTLLKSDARRIELLLSDGVRGRRVLLPVRS